MGEMPNTSSMAIDPRGVLLHPGAPKSGTTAIQSCLANRRHELLARGVLYPGRSMNHIEASRAVLGMPMTEEGAAQDERHWRRLCRAVAEHERRCVVSSEAFSVCDERLAEPIVRALGGDRVHVVLTLRSLDRVLPSAWQERVKGGGREPFTEWAQTVLHHACRAGADLAGRFWLVHDQARFVETWVNVVGLDRVSVVVLDQRQPELIFEAFGQLLGLPVGVLDTEGMTQTNRSLTWMEAEVVRAYNEAAGLSDEFQNVGEMIPPEVIATLLHSRTPPADERPAALSAAMIDEVAVIAQDSLERIRATGVHIIGSLDHLLPTNDAVGATTMAPDRASFDVCAQFLRAQHEVARRQRRKRKS